MKLPAPNSRPPRSWLGALLVGFRSLLAIGAAASAPAASLDVTVAPHFQNVPIEFDRLAFTNPSGVSLSVTRLDLLLSDLALRRTGGVWLERSNWQAFLSLGAGRASFRAEGMPAGNFDQLRFRVGVPKDLNHSDAVKYPADHPLNPNRNGLHWSWQGGYIFTALEGMWSRVGAATSGYSFHFANDWNLTEVTLAVALNLSRDASLQLNLDVAEVLNAISFNKDGTTRHSREGDPLAVKLQAGLSKAFRVVPLWKDELRESPIVSVSKTQSGTRVARPYEVGAVLPRSMPTKFTPYRFTMSSVFPVPDLPKDNLLIEERIALGRVLFHEPGLSRNNSLACASCHAESTAFADPRRFSAGVEGRTGTRNAMPLFNLAWKNSFFWDGRAPPLRAQALMPIQDHAEMDEKLERVVAKLQSPRSRGRQSAPSESQASEHRLTSAATNPTDYPALFIAAFGSPEITPEKIGLALENFLLTLTSFDSKFDRAMRGEPVPWSAQDQRALVSFLRTLTDPRFQNGDENCNPTRNHVNLSQTP